MEFELRFARDGFSIEAALVKGRALPEWFENAPRVPTGGEFYFQAFHDLSSCRPPADFPAPIPWHRLVQYADYHGFDYAASEIFVACMRAMDQTYIDWCTAEQKRRSQTKP